MNDAEEMEIAAAEAAIVEGDPMNPGRKVNPFIDKETLDAYNAYLRDWRWNMATHINLQREYMGRSAFVRSENLF